MRIRENAISEAVKEAIEWGADAAAELVNNVNLESQYGAAVEQGTAMLGQLPITAPEIADFGKRTASGVHHVVQGLHDQTGRLERSRTSGPRWRRRALLLVIALGAGAAIVQLISRHSASEASPSDPATTATSQPKITRSTSDATETGPSAMTEAANPVANDLSPRNGSAQGVGTRRKAPSANS